MVEPILYTIVILLLGEFIAINVFTHNFLAAYIAVRMKRDRGVLVQILGKGGWKWRPGTITEDHVRYKVSRKERCLIPIKHSEFRRMLGVNTFMHREGSDEVIDVNFTGRKGGDPEDTDNLYVRALHKPTINTPQERLVILGLIVILAVVCFIAWKVFNIQDTLNAMQAAQAVGATVTGVNL